MWISSGADTPPEKNADTRGLLRYPLRPNRHSGTVSNGKKIEASMVTGVLIGGHDGTHASMRVDAGTDMPRGTDGGDVDTRG
ncbi:hypothetical protein NX059_001915 [Plenodomus lindquistii]|nr:hypothetical protein NX059_001915 [Plenodomus lindquistii]